MAPVTSSVRYRSSSPDTDHYRQHHRVLDGRTEPARRPILQVLAYPRGVWAAIVDTRKSKILPRSHV
jgi:hypothetical protein